MGDALKLIDGKSCKPTTTEHSDSLAPRCTPIDFRVSALTDDLRNFEITSQVPEGLSQHAVSSREAQAEWYGKLLQAWREAKPPPTTPEEVAKLLILTLSGQQKSDVEVLLEFYDLPHPPIFEEIPATVPVGLPRSPGLPHPPIFVERSARVPESLPRRVKYEMRTLPVREDMVPDGDSIDVYVSTADPRESSNVPQEVIVAADLRSQARAEENYASAEELLRKIVKAGYMVIDLPNEEILARKYHIRLRGIDAPEKSMPYGKEAKQELVKLVNGNCLTVFVYGKDRYRRIVADVYCNGIFVQEEMLKKGLAWHYKEYDHRIEFATWAKEARAKRIGLWASSNPEKPWEWRKDRREPDNIVLTEPKHLEK